MSLEHRYLDIISGKTRSPVASLARAGLAIVEMPYRRLMIARNARYDRDASKAKSLARPTISVGNITAGGTGKTPVVQWLAASLVRAGERPAILMRGYRKGRAAISDEQVMLQQLLPGLPVEANPNRLAGAAAVLARDPGISCFVLDDGFQHRRAGRDFDLVLIHAVQPFGLGHVHPRGLLREPLSGLRRATAVLITHASEVSREHLLSVEKTVRQYASAPLFHADHVTDRIVSADGNEARPLSDVANLPFLFVTGIGQPHQLSAYLKSLGAACRGERLYADHHSYGATDIADIKATCRDAGAQAVLTTEKDWAKLQHLWPTGPDVLSVYRLQLNIRFWADEQSALLKLIGERTNLRTISTPSGIVGR